MFYAMQQSELFPSAYVRLTDEEIADLFRRALAASGRLPRSVDLALTGLGAAFLIEAMTVADVVVMRRRNMIDRS